MKYCPYCGAVLLDGTVSFCSECGKALPSEPAGPKEQGRTSAIETSEITVQPDEEPVDTEDGKEREVPVEKAVRHKASASRQKKQKKIPPKGRLKKKAGKQKRRSEQVKQPEQERQEEGYDGYYNDILPVDEGRLKEGLDQNLIKKIILLSVSALLVVGACVAIMYLL